MFHETIITSMEPLIYPNPIQGDILFIDSLGFNDTTTLVAMYDITGKIVFSETYPINTNQLRIDMTVTTNGIYTLIISSSENLFNYKIIK